MFKEKLRQLPGGVKVSLAMIAIGQLVGLIMAPDLLLGGSYFWLNFVLPVLAGLVLWHWVKSFRWVPVGLLGALIVVQYFSPGGLLPGGDINPKAGLVPVAIFEIYPLTGPGLGGYDYHYQVNAGKIISDPNPNPGELRLAPLAWWADGGALALIGYLALLILLISQIGWRDPAAWSLLAVTLIGPASSYPTRAVFFLVFWLIVGQILARNREATDV